MDALWIEKVRQMEALWIEKVRRECTLQTCAVNMRLAGYHVEFGPGGYDDGLWVTEHNTDGQWNEWLCYKESERHVECHGRHWRYGCSTYYRPGGLDTDDPTMEDPAMERLDTRPAKKQKIGRSVDPGAPVLDSTRNRFLRMRGYRVGQTHHLEELFEEHVREGRLSKRDAHLLETFARHWGELGIDRDHAYRDTFTEHWTELGRYEVEYVYPREIWVAPRSWDGVWNVWNCLELVGEMWEWRRECWWYGRWQPPPLPLAGLWSGRRRRSTGGTAAGSESMDCSD